PVVAEAHLARRLLHLGLAPGVFAVADLDQLLGRVGDHLAAEIFHQPVAPDRVADDGAFARSHRRTTAASASPAAATTAAAAARVEVGKLARALGQAAELLAQQRRI